MSHNCKHRFLFWDNPACCWRCRQCHILMPAGSKRWQDHVLSECGHPRSSMVYADGDLYLPDEPGAIVTCYCRDCKAEGQKDTQS